VIVQKEVCIVNAYVLVHGGVHAAWCWETVIGPLADAGHHVQTIDLPGRAATASAASHCTLSDYVDAIGEAVNNAPEPPVLVGHSMGGASTSQFAEHHSGDIKEIVYLSAIVPQNGETAVSTLLEAGPDSALLADGAFVVAEDQTVTIPPEHARAGFYGCCEEADVQAALRRVCREPIGPLTEPLQLGPSFAAVKKTYIGATHDCAVPPALQRVLAERAGAAFQMIESDHSPFYSARADLIRILLDHG
jgi:pimeloyl-ACP methyl ester carboxylesterase